jgi:hypothetical protein
MEIGMDGEHSDISQITDELLKLAELIEGINEKPLEAGFIDPPVPDDQTAVIMPEDN